VAFLREIVAIPSMDSDIEAVGQRIGQEMRKLGFDEVYTGPLRQHRRPHRQRADQVLLYDSHIDTVGIGDPAQWPWDPFQGKIEEGIFYARGALDEKGSTPGMVYGMAMARDLGMLEGYTLYYLGNIEEWCDGVGCAGVRRLGGHPPRLRGHRRADQDAGLPRAQGPPGAGGGVQGQSARTRPATSWATTRSTRCCR
jgi:acetylornithine deacetylase/succinyl-diaminopimelate desuccinylase-like protein